MYQGVRNSINTSYLYWLFVGRWSYFTIRMPCTLRLRPFWIYWLCYVITSLKMKDRVAAEYLPNMVMFHELFLCYVHWSTGQSMTHRIIANIYFNNERKIMTDSVHKDNVVLFKNDKGKSSKLFNCFCSSFYSYRRYFLISYDCSYIRKLIFI